jgi:hypothetical protein
MRIFAIFLVLLFGTAAYLQHNDPDPMRWMILYGTAAILCLASAFRPMPAASLYLVALIAGVWAVTLVPTIVEMGAYDFNEVEREFGGLLVVVIGLICLARCASGTAPSENAA